MVHTLWLSFHTHLKTDLGYDTKPRMNASSSFKTHYSEVLGQLFADLDTDSLEKILDAGRYVHLKTGDYLFRQGERQEIIFIVLTGRLRAILEDENGIQILGDIGEGEPVGEFSIFTGEPRSASIIATRKATLLEINKQEYLELVGKNPLFATILTNFLIHRLRRNFVRQSSSDAPKNIAFINLQPGCDIRPWTVKIEETLEAYGLSTHVFDHVSHPEDEYDAMFEELERHKGLNVLVCSEESMAWSRQCLIYADLVVIATDFHADPRLYDIEKQLALYDQNILNKKIYIVFLHGEDGPMPEHTNRWLNPRRPDLHIHIRQNNAADMRRLC